VAEDQDGSVSPVEVEVEANVEVGADEQPVLLAHEHVEYSCLVCGELVGANVPCEREDCPRVAAEEIRAAVADSPFQIGV
jgi:hypothetical protein